MNATFGDLVDAARALDDASRTQSAAQCLLRGTSRLRLEADILSGVRPLPAAAVELASLLKTDRGVPAVLSAWGRLAGASAVTVAAFTTTTTAAVSGKPLALFVTEAGLYLRGASPALTAQAEPMSLDAASLLLTQLSATESPTVYVSAEAAIPLDRLREVLRAIPDRFEMAFAVTLPKGTRLPTDAQASNEMLCPNGLPEPDAAEPEGDLEAQALRDALAPLRDSALSCALSAGGHAWLGGRLVLALRIGANAHVSDVCFSEDAILEPVLRRCIAAGARALTFPTPKPSGFVDISLPLQLELGGPTRQRPLCD
jgi:hypothetical protein